MNIGELNAVKAEPAKAKVSESGKLQSTITSQMTSGAKNLTNAYHSEGPQVSERAVVASSILTKRLSFEFRIDNGAFTGRNLNRDDALSGNDHNDDKQLAKDSGTLRFDFDTVAANVVEFVSTSLQQRADNGANTAQLEEKLLQAREGVERGFKSALNDLAGFLDTQLEEDISTAKDIITSELDSLGASLLADKATISELEKEDSMVNAATELQIRAKDGELVSIAISRQERPSIDYAESSEQGKHQQQLASSEAPILQFKTSIAGNLSAEELNKITSLVEKTEELTQQFFYGDVQEAFDTSLAMGLDTEQLNSFALQLKQNQSSSKLKQYGEVQYGADGETSGAGSNNSPKSVAQYMNKMLEVLDQSKQSLENDEEYKTIINGLINEMKDVQVPDLLSAINKFHSFTANLGIPVSDS